MEIRYTSINKSLNNNRYSLNPNRLNLNGQSIFLGKDFNILKYLKEMEMKNSENEIQNRPKRKLLPILNPQTPIKKKIQYFSIETNNISTIKNDNSNKKENKDCFITSLGNEQKCGTLNSQSNKPRRIYENNKLITSDIHLTSLIQQIRNKTKNLYNNKNEGNKSINNNYNENIAYDEKNIEPIIDINNVLNNYNERKEWDLKKKESDYNDFVNKNKEIKINNVLKILINKEKDIIDIKYKKHQKYLENIKNTIEEDENNFNQIKKDQKYYNRIIEDNLDKLKEHNKILLYLRENINQQMRKTEYEIMKKIYEIDELRVYAHFVNYIYGYDTSKYNKNFIEKESKKQPDIEILVTNVIDNYNELLDKRKNDEINNIDPSIIYNEMKLIEDRILLALKIKDKEFEDLKKYKDNNDSILKTIIDKKNQLEKEYNYLKEECNYIINFNSQQSNDKDLFIVAKDYFTFIIENFSPNNYNLKYIQEEKDNNNINPFEIGGFAVKSLELISQQEKLITEYILKLSQYENDDQKIFSEIINTRKDNIILEKIQKAKERIQKKEMLDRINIQKKSEKVYFIKRKVHQSIPKKKKIKIKINPLLIKNQEDLEFMTYQ